VVKTKPRICEACGHPMPTYHDIIGLTGMQQRVFEIVEKAGAAGVAFRTVVERAYSIKADGGPLHANTSINVMRSNMNKRLARKGLTIKASGGHYSIWRLEKL
jgi:hypothetical protein